MPKRGTLVVNGNEVKIKPDDDPNAAGITVPKKALSKSLAELKKSDVSALNGKAVEYELGSNKIPEKIYEPGQNWIGPGGANQAVAANNVNQPHQTNPNQAQPNVKKGDFHNPYNFIPAPPRDVNDPDLGDQYPVGHGVYHPDRYSGTIKVMLTTVTPLLIPDAAKAIELKPDHKLYDLRVGTDGKPYLPATTIKGMLRSVYEAITNSRMGIFQNHEDRLAWRMPAKIGPIPARVELRNGQKVLRIMENKDLLGHAAKLPRYDIRSRDRDRGESKRALRYEGTNQLPQHGEAVWVVVDAKSTVTAIVQRTDNQLPDDDDWQKGWVCVTSPNINGKKHERVFVERGDHAVVPITRELERLWTELIRNYQDTHEKDLEKRRKQNVSPSTYLGNEPGKTAWSRHIFTPSELALEEGRLCYVILDKSKRLIALTPVTISRRLFDASPWELLDPSLRPATDIKALSPAERVFGWVRQGSEGDKRGAYKGNLRIQPATCDREDAIERFGNEGFPLAILGQPKPQQFRFYSAKEASGTALNPGAEQGAAYKKGQGLRGRKVYPHHAGLPAGHWDHPTQNRTQQADQGHYQEYRRPDDGGNERDDQNRSIKAWVKPGTAFTFTIEITNLSLVELGALAWLLSLPPNHYHRLGGGKPLGFGSVRLDPAGITSVQLRSGEAMQIYYSNLGTTPPPSSGVITEAIKAYQAAVSRAYNQPFASVPFVKAFLQGAQGFSDGLPTHYPRVTDAPSPQGEAFKWFVDNSSANASKSTLPDLWDDCGLPLNPNPAGKAQQGQGGYRRG